MPNYQLDSLFAALADPTRRAVVEALRTGPKPVKMLAQPHDMALPSFLQHLDVLESRRIIRSEKIGRSRMCSLETEALRPLEDWVARHKVGWEARLDRLEQHIDPLERPDE